MISPSTKKHWSVQKRAMIQARSYSGSLTTEPFRLEPRSVRGNRGERFSEAARRFLNILVASIGIIFTAPIMLVAALVVKLTSPGPVIYKQHRVGIDRRGNRGPGSENYRRNVDHGGRLFTIYKFRTMRNDPLAGEQWASRNDPRITPIGAVLRPASHPGWISYPYFQWALVEPWQSPRFHEATPCMTTGMTSHGAEASGPRRPEFRSEPADHPGRTVSEQ